jgi:hypothetical protein
MPADKPRNEVPVSPTPFPGPYPTTIAQILVHHITTTPAQPNRSRPAGRILRRRPTRLQGLALEKLGHAIEYLVDSQLHDEPQTTAQSQPNVQPNVRPKVRPTIQPNVRPNAQPSAQSVREAAVILMRLSREVFAECRPSASAAEGLLHLFRVLALR